MNQPTQNTAVVIPAYNEGATIRELAKRCLRQLDCIVIVDDGSSDDTVAQLSGLDVTLLSNPRNLGKAASLWRGILHLMEAGYQQIITLDGDAQHAPEDIARLLEAARRHPRHLIIAARLRNREQAPSARLKANKFADFWVSWAAGQRITDSQSGFRLYPVDLFKTEGIRINTRHGFVFESEIIIEAVRHGFPCETIAIDSLYHDNARASHFRPVSDITRIVLMIAWKIISRGLYPQGLWRAFVARDTTP